MEEIYDLRFSLSRGFNSCMNNHDKCYLFTARKRSCEKVMFLHLSDSVHRGVSVGGVLCPEGMSLSGGEVCPGGVSIREGVSLSKGGLC